MPLGAFGRKVGEGHSYLFVISFRTESPNGSKCSLVLFPTEAAVEGHKLKA